MVLLHGGHGELSGGAFMQVLGDDSAQSGQKAGMLLTTLQHTEQHQELAAARAYKATLLRGLDLVSSKQEGSGRS